MLTLNCFSIALSPFLSAGGSYKKIGYYDMTKGNLSWYGNDRWIGEYTFVSLISHICSCLSLSEALFSVLNLLSHNHSHYYSHHSSASLQVSQPHILGPAPKTKRTVDDRLLRDINQSVSQILFSILSVRAAALQKLCMALRKKKKDKWMPLENRQELIPIINWASALIKIACNIEWVMVSFNLFNCIWWPVHAQCCWWCTEKMPTDSWKQHKSEAAQAVPQLPPSTC